MEEDYRSLCQVFTPNKNVNELLDWCGYKENLYDKKIMENSCGDGHILQEVVRRYIKDGLRNRIPKYKIRDGLNNDIYAIEYDFEQYKKCKKNLNRILKQYNISNIKWNNVIQSDTLKTLDTNKFDYVVGNPPYIKYKSLSLDDREYIRSKFRTCKKGKFDYCYAFIEKSIDSLKDNGRMAYLIPSSIFKNVFANDLREFLKPHIIKIYDYTTTKLFNKDTNDQGTDRLVSSIIMIIEKNSNNNQIEYVDVNKMKQIIIQKKELKGKWVFRNQLENGNRKKRFGDYFLASNTIATLFNDAYVIKEYDEDEDYIYPATGGKIEKNILKDTISPKTFGREKMEKIIFPYFYDKDGNLIRYETNDFECKYTGACEHLRKYKKYLDNRKSDKNARWFEYGRSQALKSNNKEKLLISTVITNEVKTKILPENNIPYSGIYIIPIKDKTLHEADKILKSRLFYHYIEGKGINANGKSLRITSKDINDFLF